jgi:WhiB family redox-sensing transcriptional regulator
MSPCTTGPLLEFLMLNITPALREELTAFMADALCQGDNEFLPPANPYDEPRADWDAERCKKICAGCPVTDECLQWAIVVNPVAGVWGGVNWGDRKERQALRRRMS